MKVWPEFFFHCLVTDSWCVVHWSPQVKRKGERRREHRSEKKLYNDQRDHAVCTWLLWKWPVFACDQGCIHSADSVKKTFLKQKQTEWNGDKHTWICPIETLFCDCWTNDYILHQLDAGKSVQGCIECVNVSPWLLKFLSTCAPSVHCKLSFIVSVRPGQLFSMEGHIRIYFCHHITGLTSVWLSWIFLSSSSI